MEKYGTNLRQFIGERIGAVSPKVLASKTYARAVAAEREAHNDVMMALGNDKKAWLLVDRLVSANARVMGCFEQEIYLLGLRDGARIEKLNAMTLDDMADAERNEEDAVTCEVSASSTERTE
jgi:hypothetical protein